MFLVYFFVLITLCPLRDNGASVSATALLYPSNSSIKESADVINGLVAALKTPEQTLGSQSPTDIILRLILLIMDVFTTASGSYFILPDTNNNAVSEKQQQVIAVASTDLWLKLQYMIRLEEIFFNASQLTLDPLLRYEQKRIENIHNDLFNNIEILIQANASLYKIYNRQKHRVEEHDLPKLVEGDVDFRNVVPIYAIRRLNSLLKMYPRLQYFFLHAQFASYARGASLRSHVNATVQMNYYAIAQSLVSLANEAKIGQKVQELYQKALRKTVETVKRQSRGSENIPDADQILFPEIEKVFSWEPEFNIELCRMKEKLLHEKR